MEDIVAILSFLKWWSPQNMYLEWVPHINTQNDHHFKETAVSSHGKGGPDFWTNRGEIDRGSSGDLGPPCRELVFVVFWSGLGG